jgi:hypothetical protein
MHGYPISVLSPRKTEAQTGKSSLLLSFKKEGSFFLSVFDTGAKARFNHDGAKAGQTSPLVMPRAMVKKIILFFKNQRPQTFVPVGGVRLR